MPVTFSNLDLDLDHIRLLPISVGLCVPCEDNNDIIIFPVDFNIVDSKLISKIVHFYIIKFISGLDSCDFDNGNLCDWANNAGTNPTNYTWVVHSGSTPTSGTGPSGDHSANGQGKRQGVGTYCILKL